MSCPEAETYEEWRKGAGAVFAPATPKQEAACRNIYAMRAPLGRALQAYRDSPGYQPPVVIVRRRGPEEKI